ncbi:MAG: hypothetical protein IJX28_06120 [Clostridia bacterium]|nr:hypothetical protein [Clostridia bacterium]
MEIIARKKFGIGGLYLLYALLGALLLWGSTENTKLSKAIAITGILVLLACAGVMIDFFRLPHVLIAKDADGILHLPKNARVLPTEISDVSYRRASAKGIQYQWGSVTITTYAETYKLRYVEDCEAVAKELTRLMYEAAPKAQ